MILNKETPLLNELNSVKRTPVKDYSVKQHVKWTDSLWLVYITEGATPTLRTCNRARATSDRPTDWTAERPCLLWFLFNIMDVITHRPNGRPIAQHGRPYVCMAWYTYRPTDRLAKSQKSRPNFLKATPPRSIFKPFSFCVRSRGMGVLPKTSYHLKNYYICIMKDYKDIPFKNAAIDRLTRETTKNPLISRIVKSKVGREYEPKVRKRQMKPWVSS